MTSDTNAAAEADEGPISRLTSSVRDQVTSVGGRVSDFTTERGNERDQSRLLRSLGEMVAARHAAGTDGYSPEMLALIGELAALDPINGTDDGDAETTGEA